MRNFEFEYGCSAYIWESLSETNSFNTFLHLEPNNNNNNNNIYATISFKSKLEFMKLQKTVHISWFSVLVVIQGGIEMKQYLFLI